jgi:hypothetical protein
MIKVCWYLELLRESAAVHWSLEIPPPKNGNRMYRVVLEHLLVLVLNAAALGARPL